MRSRISAKRSSSILSRSRMTRPGVTRRSSWRSPSDQSPQPQLRARPPRPATRRLGRRTAARQSHPLAEAHGAGDAQIDLTGASPHQALDTCAHPQTGAPLRRGIARAAVTGAKPRAVARTNARTGQKVHLKANIAKV